MLLDGLYQEIILDHYKNPHGRGLRAPFDGEAHHVNPTCGDEITVRVTSDFSDISYDGLGCSISQASASVLHELLVGHSAREIAEVHDAFVALMQGRGQLEADEEVLGDAVAFAGVAKFPARVKCALLPWMAFKDAAARAGVDVGAGTSPDAGSLSGAGSSSGAGFASGAGSSSGAGSVGDRGQWVGAEPQLGVGPEVKA